MVALLPGFITGCFTTMFQSETKASLLPSRLQDSGWEIYTSTWPGQGVDFTAGKWNPRLFIAFGWLRLGEPCS